MRRNLVIFWFTVLTLVVTTGMAGAATKFVIESPDKIVLGMSYGDWSAAGWQYVLKIPAATNPAADTTGANCAVDQSKGPVFFLTGNFTSAASVTRDCTVPAEKTLVIPVVNSECSTLEAPPYYGRNEGELRACATGSIDGVIIKTLQLTIDGKSVKDLGAYRVQSPLFKFHLPQDNIFGLQPGTGSSVSDGYWVIVKPLSSGPHTVHFEGTIKYGPLDTDVFSVDVTYNLTVQEQI